MVDFAQLGPDTSGKESMNRDDCVCWNGGACDDLACMYCERCEAPLTIHKIG